MEVAEVQKESSTAQNQIQTKREPFFNKDGQDGFFSKSTETQSPKAFFRPATIQPKLTVGQPNDKYEVEADSMADKVVQKLSNTSNNTSTNHNQGDVIQRKCSSCEEEEKLQKKEEPLSETTTNIQRKPIFESNGEQPEPEIQTQLLSSPVVQRKCAKCEEEEKLQKKENEELLEGDLEVQKKEANSDTNNSSDLEGRLNSSKGKGSSLPSDLQDSMGSEFGADFSNVKVHTGSEAVQMNKELGAHAFTHGNDIYFNQGKYDTNSTNGKHLLAHELTHTVQQNKNIISKRIQRETADEVIERYTDWGGLNLQEEELGAYLASQAKIGNYSIVISVVNRIDWADRDDVGNGFMNNVSVTELIQMGRTESGVNMLTILKNEINDWWGWNTEGERESSDLISAIIENGPDREIWNRNRISLIKEEAGSDLEALARMFEDQRIVDNGSVSGRLDSILNATEHLIIPGLQTGIPFSDEGFAGNRDENGEGFRDPHPSSQNQVGHFLTAVGLEFSPEVVSRPIPFFGSVRSMIDAPVSMSDEEVALRLTIGHEKGPDPNGTMAAINILLNSFIYDLLPGPEGETESERDERIARQIESDIQQQIQNIINAFKHQFNLTTEEDIAAWNSAIEALGNESELNLSAAEPFLRQIEIDPQMRGNSIQDLRLSLVGWKLGQLISNGSFQNSQQVATWIRTNLGNHE